MKNRTTKWILSQLVKNRLSPGVKATQMWSFSKWLLVALFVFLAPAICVAEDIYIAQNAAGGNTGANCANAHSASWFNNSSNWGSGTAQINAGDTVHLCGTFTGTNGQTMLTAQGSGSSVIPITILFEDDAKLTAAYWGSAGAIQAQSKSYIVIDGGSNGLIEATDNGSESMGYAYEECSNGIYLNGSQNIEIKNLEIKNMYVRQQSDSYETSNCSGINNNQADGVEVWGNCSGLSVHDNTIYYAATGVQVIYPGSVTVNTIDIYNNTIYYNCHAINIGNASSNGTVNNLSIYNNDIFDPFPFLDPADACHGNGIMVWAESTGNTINDAKIYNNYIHGNYSPGSHVTGFIFFAMTFGSPFQDLLIYNNLLVATSGYASNGFIWIQGGADNLVIANNTIVGVGSGNGIAIGAYGTASTGIRLNNNIVYDTDVYIHARAGSYTSIDNNCYYSGSQKWKLGSTPYSTLTAWRTAIGDEENSMETDPSLTNYRPDSTGDPIVDVGVDMSNYFTTDKDGITRPQGSAWDLGCYKYAIQSPKNLRIVP